MIGRRPPTTTAMARATEGAYFHPPLLDVPDDLTFRQRKKRYWKQKNSLKQRYPIMFHKFKLE